MHKSLYCFLYFRKCFVLLSDISLHRHIWRDFSSFVGQLMRLHSLLFYQVEFAVITLVGLSVGGREKKSSNRGGEVLARVKSQLQLTKTALEKQDMAYSKYLLHLYDQLY